MRAEGLKGLAFTSTNIINNTAVDVNAGSALSLVTSNVNGIFNIAEGANATARGTGFDAITINGNMSQSGSLNINRFENGLTLNGRWDVSGGSDMNFNGSQAISGAGEVVMSDEASNRILGNGDTLTVSDDITIRGAGSIGLNISNLNNQGAILAQGDNAELLIRSTSFTNDGTLVAVGVKGMNITSGDFTTAGLVQISVNSVLNRTGDYVQTDGLTNIDGVLNATGLYDLRGGTLSGKYTRKINLTKTGIK